MTAGRQELRARLDAAYELDGGSEGYRAATKAILPHAEALGDFELLFEARLAYTFGLRSKPWKNNPREVTGEWLAVLRQCLLMWHAEPHRYPEGNVSAMWAQLCQVLDAFVRLFPEPADRIRRLIDELERHCPPGHGARYVLDHERLQLAARCGNLDEVERLWRRLRAQDPPEGILVPAGVAAQNAIMWARLGRDDRAVEALAPVLAGQVPTGEGVDLEDRLLMPYLRLGRLDEAVAAHQRTYTRPGMKLEELAAHLEFCARTGNEERGLDVLHRNLGRIDYGFASHVTARFDAMWTAAAAALLCRRAAEKGLDREWVWECDCEGPDCGSMAVYTYTELGANLRWSAMDFAERMDELNGTSHLSERIDALLHAEPIVDRLDLPPDAAPPRHRAVPRLSPHLDATDADGLRRTLDRARAMEPGVPRIRLIQRVMQNAMAGGEAAVLLDARFALLEDLLRPGREDWRTDLFACLVELFRAHDARPALLGADRPAVMWRAVPILLPRVLTRFGAHLRQIRAFLDLLERHCRPGADDLHHVRWFRTWVEARAGDRDAARAAWARFQALPRVGRFTAREYVLRSVRWWLDLGCDPEAFEAMEPLLDTGDTGREDYLLPAYLRAGRLDKAAEVHERTHRTAREAPEVAAHLEFCARTGALDRGREILRRSLGLFHVPPGDRGFEFDRLRAFAAAILLSERVVAAGRDETWTWPADECCPPEDGWSHARMAGACRDLLTVYSRRWEEILGTDFHTRAALALADGG
ncbi:hypothetical protein [Thermomonospora cellulosilytica]|uniref:Uncharacterized protein n=1 Tax=Thermomonospora cellulosilytica TaxID=1411118 RepID=A0A7W3R9L7_9ACTN|nr:hypothetical protein [Thermomonospora cellulosilytica]MBA9004470.1 hypothetical protein [Thermomonospora cellulosilytica]